MTLFARWLCYRGHQKERFLSVDCTKADIMAGSQLDNIFLDKENLITTTLFSGSATYLNRWEISFPKVLGTAENFLRKCNLEYLCFQLFVAVGDLFQITSLGLIAGLHRESRREPWQGALTR